jgi:hypothetical protein
MPPAPRRPWYAAVTLLGTVLVASTLSGPSSGALPHRPAEAVGGGRVAAAAAAATHPTRPFRATSYWNTPLGNAPRDPHSARYIRDAQVAAHSQGFLKLVLGAWGMPRYRAGARAPLYRINPASGPTVRVHIPARARPMPTSDAAVVVVDPISRQVVTLGGARFNSSAHRWTAATVSRYALHSNGIARGLPTGSRKNLGHRGIPGSVQTVTRKEISRGVIKHRLEMYWWETASHTPGRREAYFPMTGAESGHGATVPEGIVIRIKRSVDLRARHLSPAAYTIARALQRYGAVVGDNSGSGNNIKLQANARWAGVLTPDSLKAIRWRDFAFVKGGFRP